MKETYESLELEVIVFDIEDVITTSGNNGSNTENGNENETGNGGGEVNDNDDN